MRRNNTIYLIALSGLMIAIMFLFGFTPLGTISVGMLTITLMGIPIAIMACVFGLIAGAVGGLIWGIISIIQAFAGMDATGVLILNAESFSWGRKIAGLLTMCIGARMLAGFLAGLIFDLVKRYDKKGWWSSLAASISVSLFNTIFFMTFFCLFFFKTKEVQDMASSAGWSTVNPFAFVFAIIGVNFIVEFLVNGIVASAASYGIYIGANKIGLKNILPRFFQKKEVKIETKEEIKEEIKQTKGDEYSISNEDYKL